MILKLIITSKKDFEEASVGLPLRKDEVYIFSLLKTIKTPAH